MRAHSRIGFVSFALSALLAALAVAGQTPPPDPVSEANQKGDLAALRKYAERGDLRAQKILVIVYLAGTLGQEPDPAEAFRWEKQAAAQGDPDSAANVGFAYLHGKTTVGVARDPKEAAGWLAKAGLAGNANACKALSDLRFSGAGGLPRDPAEGTRWWALGMDASDVERAWKHATNFRSGNENPPKDPQEGVLRLVKAVQTKADPADLYCLGLFYFRGPAGFPKNAAEGIRLIALAADKGDWEALMFLARTYRYGVGVPKDPAQARIWLQKAAASGHFTAQAWLGEMLVDGEGGPRDFGAAEPLLQAAYDGREPVAELLWRANLEKKYLAANDPARKPPIADLIWPAARDRGAQAAEAQYLELRKSHPDAYDFSEIWLNYVGYRLLQAGRAQDAADLLRLNAVTFPESSNVWDSLAEAQSVLGQTEDSIANYRKSLALNPANTNAAEQIARMEKARARAAAAAASDERRGKNGLAAYRALSKLLDTDLETAADNALMEAVAALRGAREKSGEGEHAGTPPDPPKGAPMSKRVTLDEATSNFDAARSRFVKAHEALGHDGQAALELFAEKNGFTDLLLGPKP
jgi:TPR repeat protein